SVGLCEVIELRERLTLELEIFENCLDDEIAVREVGEVRRQRQARKRRIALRFPEPALLDSARKVTLDGRAAPLTELFIDLTPDGLESGLNAHLCNPGPHRPEPDDPDLPDLHYAFARANSQRNETSPWPGSYCETTSSRTGSSPASRRRGP